MVFVPFNHSPGTVHKRRWPLRAFCQSIVAIALGIGFVNDIKTVFVTKVVPGGLVGTMSAADGVEIEPLHHFYIEFHLVGRDRFAAIGIDVEPAEAPPRELVTTIATPAERESLHAYLYGGRLLFAAKEAVYKAVAGLDGIFLEHHDVEIDFAKHGAAVRNGRTVALRFCVSQRLLALAFIRR